MAVGNGKVEGNTVQEKRRRAAREERKSKGITWKAPPDDGIGAFPLGPDGQPIPEDTPGQAESQAAFENFNEGRNECPWWIEYLELRAEGWEWRKAALIAWMASPRTKRWPKTQAELATGHLGLESDRVLRKWREDDPAIDERVARLQVAPLFQHRRDVIEALVAVSKQHHHLAHSDRKLFLEMTGDYKPKREITGKDGGALFNVGDVVAALRKADEAVNDDGDGVGFGISHDEG